MPDAASASNGADPDGSRNRHRAQAEAEKPEQSASCQPTSSGVLDKLFGKRLLQAGRYIMSHKSWMKTVPTENCDVLMTFAGPPSLTTTTPLPTDSVNLHDKVYRNK
ncbi:hypothetical protein QTP70_006222 [Hemibagrus guttatus]|uniref:Uncharacterized protein n=1 Tax=Hemibagrus guttatus TaxID=175788 RepID=A0AAE0V3P5_9TELE|nr:hypothetical protein QTP70_006222 [Hemibagrus guttatus]